VVERVLVVLKAEAQGVRSLDLAQVDDAGVLVVAEQERAARVGVPMFAIPVTWKPGWPI